MFAFIILSFVLLSGLMTSPPEPKTWDFYTPDGEPVPIEYEEGILKETFTIPVVP